MAYPDDGIETPTQCAGDEASTRKSDDLGPQRGLQRHLNDSGVRMLALPVAYIASVNKTRLPRRRASQIRTEPRDVQGRETACAGKAHEVVRLRFEGKVPVQEIVGRAGGEGEESARAGRVARGSIAEANLHREYPGYGHVLRRWAGRRGVQAAQVKVDCRDGDWKESFHALWTRFEDRVGAEHPQRESDGNCGNETHVACLYRRE